MLHPSTKKLIDKLSEMTRKQRVSWIEGENGTIVHDTEGYRVVLTPEPHGVVLTDAVGREIETCSPEEIADEKDAAGRPYSQFIGELFREAHRHARGAEKAIRTLLAGLEAADEPPPEAAAPEPEPEPETLTDETASTDGETAITAAVATLADQINNTAPMAGPEISVSPEPDLIAAEPEAAPAPEPEPEPAAEPEPAPLPAAYAETEESGEEETQDEEAEPEETMEEAAALVAPEPEPEPHFEPEPQPEPVEVTADPEPEPAPAPSPMQQRFSLSGIPYGVGFAGTQTLAEPAEMPAETAPSEPRTLVIDGTEDLPDGLPAFDEEPAFPPLPERQAEAEDDAPPAIPRRFNPWN